MSTLRPKVDSKILNYLYETVDPGETMESFEKKIDKYLRVLVLKFPENVDDFVLYYKGRKKFTEIAKEKSVSVHRVRTRVFHIIFKIRTLHFQEKNNLQGLFQS